VCCFMPFSVVLAHAAVFMLQCSHGTIMRHQTQTLAVALPTLLVSLQATV
jgi:hypothetical protein